MLTIITKSNTICNQKIIMCNILKVWNRDQISIDEIFVTV